MRLITWNCKGGFRKKHNLITALGPDVVVLPESEKLTALNYKLGAKPVNSVLWFGEQVRKGLGVVSYGEYSMEVHPSYVDHPFHIDYVFASDGFDAPGLRLELIKNGTKGATTCRSFVISVLTRKR